MFLIASGIKDYAYLKNIFQDIKKQTLLNLSKLKVTGSRSLVVKDSALSNYRDSCRREYNLSPL